MRLLICFLLLSFPACAQINSPLKDSSIIKSIDLPATEPFDTAKSYYSMALPFIYLSSDMDLYDYFDYETTMKYREFNFADYHILGEKKNGRWTWVMRENKKAFTQVPVITLPGHISSALPQNRNSFFLDTVIRAINNTDTSKWYTTGRGDCQAFFNYKLFADKYHPVLLMKEWNYWGGCRAAGSRNYTLCFSMPAGIIYTLKNTLLMDSYNKLR